MTNFDKFQYYMKDFRSPQAFCDMAYYYIITSCLARRVSIGAEHSPLYANIYPILVGEPGIGKGLVLKQVEQFLRFHKRANPTAQKEKLNLSTEEEAAKFATAVEEYETAMKNRKGKIDAELPLRLPMGANATTYEALISAMSAAARSVNYKQWNETLQKFTTEIYTHKSLVFCLEEISSLFRDKKHSKAVVDFLITAYDCGDYTYDTRTQGKDEIRKLCLNLLGGTTPAFMRDTFDDRLLNDGFASRVMFVYADKNRHNELFIPELTKEQKQCKIEVLAHTAKLLDLYGRCDYTPEAREYLKVWWRDIHPKKRNTNLKLKFYYARKDIHVQKIAMAMHFGERLDMTIGIESCVAAVEFLDKIERQMHHAVAFDSKNPLAKLAKIIEEIVHRWGPQSFNDLLAETFNEGGRDADLKETLSYMTETNKLSQIDVLDKKKNVKLTVYHHSLDIDEAIYSESRYAMIR